MKQALIKNKRFIVPAFLLAFTIFLIDELADPNFDIGVLYVAVVLITSWIPGRNITITTGYVVSILSIINLFPELIHPSVFNVPLVNNLISLLGIWASVWFVYRLKTVNRSKFKDQERLDALFENATEGFLIVNTKGEIVMANPAASNQFGYERNELIGLTVEALVPGRFSADHSNYRKTYYRAPRSRAMGSELSLYGKRKDSSEFPVEISLSSFYTQEGMFVIAFIIDISERKKDEEAIAKNVEEIQKLNSQLESIVEERTKELAEAIRKLKRINTEQKKAEEEIKMALEKEKQLNEFKTRFVNMASHEFRTPLSAILSSISLIGKYNKDGEEEKREKHIHRVQSSVKNMNDILNDFLSLGKLEEGKVHIHPEEFELEEMLHESMDNLQQVAKDGQNILLVEKEIIGRITTDKNLLRNILTNLLSNAIKYSPENSEIKLIVSNEKDKIQITVEDKGMGIPPDDQEHLFERFFRANNASNIQGTGLGLNIVKKYTQLLGGSIGFKSELNIGSSFYIYLPKQSATYENHLIN